MHTSRDKGTTEYHREKAKAINIHARLSQVASLVLRFSTTSHSNIIALFCAFRCYNIYIYIYIGLHLFHELFEYSYTTLNHSLSYCK